MVGTAVTLGHGGGKFQVIDLVNGEHGGLHAVLIPFPGDQSRAEGAHDTGNVGTNRLAVRDFLKASKNRVIVEGAALYHDIFTESGGVGYLDNLEQCVLDNRVSQTCGDIGHLGALFLGLLYLGIHKHSTAGSQIDRMLGKKRRLGKILYGVVQGFSKGLNKGTAAGGAGLVQLHTVYGVVLDADTFHILTADIQDTVHVRIKEFSGVIMRNSLNFALVQHEGCLNQGLAVAGGAGTGNARVLRKEPVDILDGADGGRQGVTIVTAVEGIKQGSVLTYQRSLGGGASGVDAEEAVALIGLEITAHNLMTAVTLLEFGIFMLIGKKRLHTGHLEIHLDMVLETLLHIA